MDKNIIITLIIGAILIAVLCTTIILIYYFKLAKEAKYEAIKYIIQNFSDEFIRCNNNSTRYIGDNSNIIMFIKQLKSKL